MNMLWIICWQRSEVKHIVQRTVTTAKRTWTTRIKALCWYAVLSVVVALLLWNE